MDRGLLLAMEGTWFRKIAIGEKFVSSAVKLDGDLVVLFRVEEREYDDTGKKYNARSANYEKWFVHLAPATIVARVI